MALRSRLVLGLAGLAALAACSDSAPTASDPVAAPSFNNASDNAGDNPNRHLFEVKGSPSIAAARAGKGKPGGGTGISYHGGPVLQAATKVVAIYWAASPIYNNGPAAGAFSTNSNSGDGSLVGHFMRNLGGSPYFNINTTYKDGSGRAIANVVNYTGYWANNTSAPSGTTKVTDAQMIAMLSSGFTSGKLVYDPNTLYVIFTAGAVNLGGGFGTSYCGYHTHGTVSTPSGSKVALYSAMPYDYAYPSACTNGTASPNGDPGADNEVSVLAHEIEETTTDPMGNAWYDSRGYENADKCAWNFGTTFTSGGGVANMTIGGKAFLVQQNWINSGSGGCRLSWP
ncbi:MAG: hypothetical protein V4503_10585 [Gemmatimonadota bacterium]